MSLPPKLIKILSNIDILRLVMKFSGHSEYILLNILNCYRPYNREPYQSFDKQKHVNLLSVQGMSSTSAYGCLNCSEPWELPGY